ncbi:snf2 family helicase [Sporothrix schenckii 1099-18]|uniref:Snf2 family helicase n=1 Tax=Sporothrix schenckii 1099-18 TaxID=1397361 RepID=A0A0F2LVV6_SPOSC|nr:snf2 family helicase [Sporothrix schenckii 1099-18]KJR81607.1 snf2 family helicase [Sporothrix schenckii 1099-18]
MDIPLSAYIAAGSFTVPLDGADIVAPDQWLMVQPEDAKGSSAEGASTLPHDTTLALLKLPALAPSVRPLLHRWIRIAFRGAKTADGAAATSLGICRLYVLPDDAYRRLVPRSDIKVRRDLQRLLNGLDYADAGWRGVATASPLLVHDARVRVRQDDDDDDNDDDDGGATTLLQMFNTIPSPQPRVDLVHDESYQRVMDALMTSRVPGLKETTTLYGHQMRSAAVMLQRELQPGRVVDPRLLRLREQSEQPEPERSEDQRNERSEDQKDNTWYYDDVTGEVLRTARLYDGVSGGILAEEMGTGKTLICLALILATRAFPAELPGVYDHRVSEASEDDNRRKGPRSLGDMAATIVSRQSVPWKLYLADTEANADEFRHCIAAIQRNPAMYVLPRFKATARDSPRASTSSFSPASSTPITLSSCSLVLVPANLVRQWEEEIAKHTQGLNVLVVAGQRAPVPTTEQILEADVLLFSIPRFEKLVHDREVTRAGYELRSPLAAVHFKRVIVDEGHRLGNAKMGRKSNLLLVLDCLQVSARWIVTGTPSTGLFGVEQQQSDGVESVPPSPPGTPSTPSTPATAAALQERKDLERIGAMASLYLRVRPWANTIREVGGHTTVGMAVGDAPADWAVYVMQPHHSNRSSGGRRDGLRATLDSLIIRHRTSEVGALLPAVDERVVVLDGSYQDRLCLNLFSMMIVFNAVQSQRTDQDYFFHPRQRGALLRLLSNIRQATFFGANFYSAAEIATALETAETFLEDRKVPISDADEQLLRQAITFGHVAVGNRFKRLADACHEVPIYVADMPGGGSFAASWSIDGEEPSSERGGGGGGGLLTCTAAPMVRALQQYVRPCMDAPTSLRAMFDDGRFEQKGRDVLRKQQESAQKQSTSRAGGGVANNGSTASGTTVASANTGSSSAAPVKGDPTLAGNTKLGEDNHAGSLKRRSSSGTALDPIAVDGNASSADVFLAAPLANTRLVSTASAKLSYLLDAIVRHQAEEQIIVFYDNENVAFYLAEHLEILQIQHLIYARGITAERRAQYVATFNGDAAVAMATGTATPTPTSSPFRVLLMDLSQAAFGLDMRSASRVYFTSPVLNPQVEAQAVGRVRRISQGAARGGGVGVHANGERRVLHVETLVLRDSLEEVIVDRRHALTPAEHRRIKTLLDDGPIYEWVRNARVVPMAGDGMAGVGDGASHGSTNATNSDVANASGPAQMAPLQTPQFLFGRGSGRVVHPDEGLVVMERAAKEVPNRPKVNFSSDSTLSTNGQHENTANTDGAHTGGPSSTTPHPTDGDIAYETRKPKKRKLLPNAPVRFA